MKKLNVYGKFFKQIENKVHLKRWCHDTVKNQQSYLHHIGKYPLLYKTIGDLVKAAAVKYPRRDYVVFVEENLKYNFQDFDTVTDHLAAGLLNYGFKKGDKLALWGPNTSEWYISFFGAAKVGIVPVLINPFYKLTELEYSLNKTQVTGIITPIFYKSNQYYQMLQDIFVKLTSTSGHLKHIILTEDGRNKDTLQWKEIVKSGQNFNKTDLHNAKQNVLPDDPLCIQLTSGTTGKSKAALVSHFNFVNNSYFISHRSELYDQYHKTCMPTPFFHAYATDIIMCPALHAGATIVVPSKLYNPQRTLESIQNEQCTYVNGTPTMFVDMVSLQKQYNYNLSSLVFALSGGSPCPPALFQNMLDILGVRAVKSVYGLTELSGVIFESLPNEDKKFSLETVGHVLDHIEVKVVDETGKTVSFGKPGELCVRGYLTMLEYFNDEQKTRETKGIDGWFKTGDKVILYENGYGQVVGRIKDMIIRGGENIFPREIEDLLNTHSNVLESQVFGVDNERLGEEVAVCVRVQNRNEKLTLNDIQSYCTNKIADFKIPKYLEIVDEFPKTASGKIQKHKLKNIYQNKMLNISL